MDRLVRSKHQSVCPFKGTASYYSLKDGAENAVWTYEKPYDEMSVIKERLAFYPDKVDSITAGAGLTLACRARPRCSATGGVVPPGAACRALPHRCESPSV